MRRLLASARGVPIALAVVPAAAHDDLARALDAYPAVDVLQHGWAHVSHAPGANNEYPAGRAESEVTHELIEGRDRLRALFGPRALPAFAPPWHAFDETFLALLPRAGIVAISRKGPRAGRFALPGLMQANAHVAPILWTDPPSFAGDETYLRAIVEHLAGRRLGRFDEHEATGLLTHHLVQNDASYAFIDAFAAVVREHPGAAWVAAREMFAG